MILSMIFVNLHCTSNAFPDTVEDEINSSGTDDLDINPEEDQFEEPVLGKIIVCNFKSSEHLTHKLQIESFYHI